MLKMLTSRRLTTIAATLILGFQALPAMAITPDEILQGIANQSSAPQGFTGTRTLKVYRQGTNPLEAQANVTYADRKNYDIEITEPNTIGGIKFHMKNGVNSAYFPDEKLHLIEGGANTSYMPERVILSLFPEEINLLRNNYNIEVIERPDKKEEFINNVPVYVVDFVPKNKFTYSYKDDKNKDVTVTMPLTPRRRYWLDKQSFYVLKESRYWDSLNPNGTMNKSEVPYSEAGYVTFKPGAKPAIPDLKVSGQLNKVNLSGKEKNSFLTYSSLAKAKEAGIQVNLPSTIPDGFQLKDIQVFSLFGAQIKVLNFTDGLNDLMITIRPQQNAFVTLMAGAFSLNLIKKITDLSAQAPNNYWSTNNEKFIAVTFGDVPPPALERVALSMNY